MSSLSNYHYPIKSRLQRVQKKINDGKELKIDKDYINIIFNSKKEIKDKWTKTNGILHEIYSNIHKMQTDKKIE